MLKLYLIFACAIVAKSQIINLVNCRVDGPAAQYFLLDVSTNETNLIEITNGSDFDPSQKTFFVIHGWMETAMRKWNFKVAKAIARKEPNNVILMDYSKWSHKLYYCAANIVEAAGYSLADFIIEAIERKYTSVDKIYLNGLSLGGHVAGLAGRTIEEHFGEKIHRITGLDPAGPLFSDPFHLLPELTLKRTDAKVVDVLHTSTLFGNLDRLGTADFHSLNKEGGIENQPACMQNMFFQFTCSHLISRRYYIESINSCGIKGEDVDDPNRLVTFGYNMPEETIGVFEFYPNEEEPFGTYPSNCTQH